MVYRDRLSESVERQRRARRTRRRIGIVVVLLGLLWGLAVWQTGLGRWLFAEGGVYLDTAGKTLFVVLLVIGAALYGRGERSSGRD